MLMPAPNFFAGILCGIANHSLVSTFQAGVLWGVLWAFWQMLKGFPLAARKKPNGEVVPSVVLLSLEFLTAAGTAVIVGSAAYGVKKMFF